MKMKIEKPFVIYAPVTYFIKCGKSSWTYGSNLISHEDENRKTICHYHFYAPVTYFIKCGKPSWTYGSNLISHEDEILLSNKGI